MVEKNFSQPCLAIGRMHLKNPTVHHFLSHMRHRIGPVTKRHLDTPYLNFFDYHCETGFTTTRENSYLECFGRSNNTNR